MIVRFKVYPEVSRDGYFDPKEAKEVAIHANAIDAIDPPREESKGEPDENSVPQLHVAGRIYMLAESWDFAVTKWERALR